MFDCNMPYEGKGKGQSVLFSWAFRAGVAEEHDDGYRGSLKGEGSTLASYYAMQINN